MTVAVLGTLFFSHAISLWWNGISIGLIAVMLVLLSLTTAIELVELARGIRRTLRYGGLPFWRPRWWFQLARMILMLSMITLTLAAVTLLADFQFGLVALGVFVPFAQATTLCWACFMFTCSIGLMLAKFSRLKPTGRSFRCVWPFYAFSMCGILVSTVGFGGLQLGNPIVMLMALAVVCLGMAAGLRWKQGIQTRYAGQ